MNSPSWRNVLFATSALVAVSAAVSAVPAVSRASGSEDHSAARVEGSQGSARSLAHQLSAAMEGVVQEVQPSVVSISSARRVRASANQTPFGGALLPEPFSDLFGGHSFGAPDGAGTLPDMVQRGTGSGVVVDEDGLILTNHHVVRDADQVTVTFSDERRLEAEVVGVDPKTDLAVLRVDAHGLPAARLGDSDQLRPGELVLAAGSPFGLSSTVTSGIVSATGRSRVGITDYEDFIQTDAAINPGNSGGPLVNLDGEVVGINTAILSRTGAYNGIGLAIPINMARFVMDSLIQDGRIVRGWLGAYIQDLDEGLARSFGFDGTDGVLVGEVVPDSPAAKAGLRQGDIILRFGDTPVRRADRLRMEVAATRPDRAVDVRVFRDGAEQGLEVVVGELEGQLTEVTADGPAEDLGLTLQDLTPDSRRQLSLDSEVDGVLVTGVDPLGTAAGVGLRQGDVILEVQGHPVQSVREFRAALREHDGEHGVRLTVHTGGASRFVYLPLAD